MKQQNEIIIGNGALGVGHRGGDGMAAYSATPF